MSAIQAFHGTLPGYAPTPLVDARHTAAHLGVRRLWVKDESYRFDLAAYKILGASWAANRALADRNRESELIAASEGNHGRAVARMARWLGLRAHILVPRGASPARIARIESEAAQVTIVDGDYDYAVEQASQLEDERHILITDAALHEGQISACDVIDGYSTLFHEIDAQIPDPPTRIAIQIGVGSLAAAAVKHYGPGRVIGVEPAGAACIHNSLAAGRLLEASGPYDPRMAGLNCGRASFFAWPVLLKGLASAVEIHPDQAEKAAALLAKDGIFTTPTGAAGLAGLFSPMPLQPSDDLLIIATEGRLSANL